MQKSASFERNFSEYQISRAKLADEFVIVNDGKICDLVGREIIKFFCKDCEKNFDEMIKTFDKRVKKLVLFGQTKEKIKNTALKYGFDEIEILDNLKQCVDYCKSIAKKGDTVLLSPACASWDMYSSYEVRGDEFIEIVNSL